MRLGTCAVNRPDCAKLAPMEPELLRIASRVVWWDAPEHVVSRLDDCLCRMMALANRHHRLGLGDAGPLPVRRLL